MPTWQPWWQLRAEARWRRGSGATDGDVRGAVTRRNVTLLERNGSGAHDRVVLVDGLRPSLWAAKWVQVRHAQMVATKNLESRELAQAGRPRDRHPCLDPRAVGGVLSRVDPASAGYAAVHRQM
jgi:hypothetical protein